MLVLLVATALRDELPAIVFEQPNELVELHTAHRGGASAGAERRRLSRG
jgi:hypothetical protein